MRKYIIISILFFLHIIVYGQQVTLNYTIGGDQVTNDEELIFRIYDSGTIYHQTGNSVIDENVSITNGVATISNVDVNYSTSYQFTISEVDVQGNESAQSNIISITISDAPVVSVPDLPTIHTFKTSNTYKNRIYFDSSESLTGSSVVGFTVPYRAVDSVKIVDGATTGHYLVLSSPFSYWNIITVKYAGGSDIQDASANALLPFTWEYVTNYINEPDASIVRWASAAGSGLKDGSTEDNAWTYQDAATYATAGMTVYCKAGVSSSHMYISNSGTADAPIKFIGYKTSVPGGLPVPIASNYWTNGDAFNTVEMPTLSASSRETSSDIAVKFESRQFIIMKNFQVENFKYGYEGWNLGAQNIVIENCNGARFGKLLSDGSGYAARFSYIDNNKIQIKDCKFANATMSIVVIAGDNNLVINTETLANEGQGVTPNSASDHNQSTDYHLIVDGSYSVVKNTRHEHVGQMEHAGHGVSIKEIVSSVLQNNLIDGSSFYNLSGSTEFRHPQVQNNNVKNCYYDLSGGSTSTMGVVFRDGASYNVVENCLFENQPNHYYAYLNYFESSESGYTNTIQGNEVINSIFKGTTGEAIRLGSSNDYDVGTVLNNYIKHCTFDTFGTLAVGSTLNTTTNFYLQNSIFNDVTNKTSGTAKSLTFTNSLFWGGFGYEGSGAISTIDPDMTLQYQPQATLISIDVPTLSAVSQDYGYKTRNKTMTTVGAVMHADEAVD